MHCPKELTHHMLIECKNIPFLYKHSDIISQYEKINW